MSDKAIAESDKATRFKSRTYQLIEKIGEGGFGQVYKAIHRKTKRSVAIKLLTLSPEFDSEKRRRYIERFERETLFGSRLNHPNIVGLLDKGQCADDLIYAVFEFVDGQSLKERIADSGALSPLEAAGIMVQVLDALAYAHKQGVIHRDIKPANIMLTNAGTKTHAKILDFGIGTFVQEVRQLDYKSITLTQESLGTPSYSAPEQLRGEPPTPKSDLYVWGLVFIECLTGRPAISGSNLASIFHKQLNQSNVPLPAAIAGHPVASILRRVLHKKIDERAGNAENVYNEFIQLNFSTLVGDLGSAFEKNTANNVPRNGTNGLQTDDDHTLVNDRSYLYTGLTERKQITVFCISLNVKTVSQDTIDHEVIDALYRDQKSQCCDIAIRYGAFQAGALGDTQLFYFGYPTVSDNDCRLCARAALETISNLNKKNSLLKHTQGISVQARIGIHVGLVTTYADSIPEGDTPNIAMELARIAQPNQILCTDNTRKMLEGYIEFEPSQVKELGVDAQELPLYLMIGERHVEAYGFLRASRQHHEFIGRKQQLVELAELLSPENKSNGSKGKGKCAHVYGEAGIGKTRLVIELRNQAQNFNHIIAQCLPEYKNNALFPILNILKYKYSSDALPPDAAVERLRAIVGNYPELDEGAIPLLCAWMNLPLPGDMAPVRHSPAVQKEILFDVLSALLTHRTETEQLNDNLFILEDLHWGDPTSVEFIAYFLSCSAFRKSQHVFVSTSRQILPKALARTGIASVEVPKFSEDKALEFISLLFDKNKLAQPVLEVVATRTDGIPLFIEELVAMLKQKRLVQRLNGIISFTNPGDMKEVPNTLRESLHQKLDDLLYAKETAQLAATIGREFDYNLLVSASRITEEQLQINLNELLESQLIYRQRKVDGDRYIFKHALVRDAAYESMVPTGKKETHRRIAETLEQLGDNGQYSDPGILAMHWGAAEIYDKAVCCGNKAANIALKRSAANETIAQASNVLDWISHLDTNNQVDPLLSIYGLLTSAYMETKGWASDEVLYYSDASLNLLKESNRHDEVVAHLWWKILNGIVGGKREGLEVISDEMEVLLDAVKAINKSAIKCAQGFYRFAEGDRNTCIEALHASINYYDELENKSHQQTFGFDVGVFAKATLGRTYADTGQRQKAMRYVEQAVVEAKYHQNIPSMGISLMYYAIVHQHDQNKNKVKESTQELISISEEYNLPIYKGYGQMLYDWSVGETAQANTVLLDLKNAGSLFALGQFQSFYADTYIQKKEYAKAMAKLDECFVLNEVANEHYYTPYLFLKKAQCVRLSHGLEKALPIYDKAYELAEGQEIKFILDQVEQTKNEWLITE